MRKTLFIMLLFTVLARAANIPPDFTTVTVPVQSQAAGDVHPALVDAFSQALVKLSGHSEVMTLPEVEQQFPTVEKLVQKYSYQGDNDLRVTFDQHALITLLVQLHQPIWLTERPVTLIWLSINGQEPISTYGSDPVAALLRDDAGRRGLPINFPRMDESDQAIWKAQLAGISMDTHDLEKIARRYQSTALFSGELTATRDNVAVNWLLVWRGQTWRWHNEGSITAVLQAGIDKLADLMADQLAVPLDEASANSLWVAIMGVNNLADYSSVLAALKKLPPVLGVVVQDIGSHGLLARVTTIGQTDEPLKEALAASGHFSALADRPGSVSENFLNYRWNP